VAETGASSSGRIPDSHARLHNLVYSVLYPAFLGSFIFGLLSQPVTRDWHWGLLLAFYFTLQQIEGTLSGPAGYSWGQLVRDAGEMALMVLAFIALGLTRDFRPDIVSLVGKLPPQCVLAAIFLLPPLARILGGLRDRWKRSFVRAPGFYWALTILSLVATVAAYSYDEPGSLRLAWILLLVYFTAFQIFNEWLPEGSFRRPPAVTETAASVNVASAVSEADRAATAALSAAEQAAAAAKDASAAAQSARDAAATVNARKADIAAPVVAPSAHSESGKPSKS
jgi:hypothetical protein